MGSAAILRLLLDTHVWVWSQVEPERLSRKVAAAIELPENELWLSPISVWEVALLFDKGRLVLNGLSADTWVDETLKKMPVREAPVTHQIALTSRAVDLPHQDPADRFLAATAKVMDLTLVTADARLAQASDISVLRN